MLTDSTNHEDTNGAGSGRLRRPAKWGLGGAVEWEWDGGSFRAIGTLLLLLGNGEMWAIRSWA